jgi:glycerol kinase
VGGFVGIDQGTSGTTVLVLDPEMEVRGRATAAVDSRHPAGGGVEQDPWEVLESVVAACGQAMAGISEAADATGFAHQGETVVAWDAVTLEPLSPAIVWSDRRPEMVTARLRQQGLADRVTELSGMRLDPYFCAAKYRWMLDELPTLREHAGKGRLRLGTLETWLLLQLGAGTETDLGTASRTQLTRLGEPEWDPELLGIFGISAEWLVPIGDSLSDRGVLSHPAWDFDLPVRAVMVDQPAALVGNGCLDPGDMKVTYGTGAFVLANAGRAKPEPQTTVINSVGWGDGDGPVYILDGGVLSVGSALAWLDGLGVGVGPEAHHRLVGRGPSSLVVLPALNGTGSPRWDRDATVVISGMSAATTGDDLLHGFLDSFAFRVREIVEAMEAGGVPRPSTLRVDGGLTRSAYLMQRQADSLGVPVEVALDDEATALGVAVMARRAIGESTFPARLRQSSAVFEPDDVDVTDRAYKSWRDQTSGAAG